MIKRLFRLPKLDLFKFSTQAQAKIPSLTQGWQSYDQGDFVTSISLCNQVLAQQPDNAEAYLLLGTIAQSQNNLTEAESHYRRGLTYQPESAKLHNNLGNVFLAREQHEEAEQHYLAALQHDPNLAQAHCNLGIVLSHRNERVAAIAHLHKALEFDPDSFEAVCSLGQILSDAGRFAEAQACLERALLLRPNSADQHVQLGMLFGEHGKFNEALAKYRQALELNPNLADAYYGMALSLRGLDQYQDAMVYIKKGMELSPGVSNLHLVMGLVLFDLGNFEQASHHLDLAIQIQPNNAEAHTQHAFLALHKSDFKQGWTEYEYRLRTREARQRPFKYPRWDGTPLTDQTILVYAEQGLGDEIMFASCLPSLISEAGHCVIECSLKLEPIFRRSFPTATVYGAEQHDADCAWLSTIPPIDVQIPIGSLPLYYRKALHDFPQRAYLKADEDRVRYWRDKLNSLGPGLKVGISWRGGIKKTRSRLRSIVLADWLPILRQENVHFISLQYTPCEEELAELLAEHGITVQHWPEAITPYDETAALVCALDLVISVSTAVIHLCGALGKPAWVMLPSNPEWRYGIKDAKMPWYPKVRLFRQTIPGDWTQVVGDVVDNLRLLTETGIHALPP